MNRECLPAPERKNELAEAAPLLQVENQLYVAQKREMKPKPPPASLVLARFSLFSTKLYCLNLGM